MIEVKDSLAVFLEKSYNDSIPIDIKKDYAAKASKIIYSQSNDSLHRINLFKLANRYLYLYDLENYKKTSQEIIIASKAKNDSLSLAKASVYLAEFYAGEFISDSSYQYYFNAERIYKALNDNTNIVKCILNKSVIQFNEKDYIGSEKSAFEALKFLKKINDYELSYQAYNVLGIISGELNEYSKALDFHNKALLSINESDPAKSEKTFYSLHNIGLVYQNSGNQLKAINYFEKLIEQKSFDTNSKDYAVLIDNLGYSKLKISNYKNLPDLFLQSLEISKKLNYTPNILSSEVHLAEYYLKRRDTLNALNYANQAYHRAKFNRIDKYTLLSLKELLKSDSKNSAKYSEEYIKINDSLQLAERQNRNKLARIEYETEELVIEKGKLKEQQKTIIYTALGIFLIGVFIFVIRFQAAKNRELRLVQEQQLANEEIYQLMINQQNKIEEVRQLEKKRIAQELHDGVLGKLFGTRLHLGMLNEREDKNANAERVVFIEELQTLEQEIREISHDLNSEKTAVFNNFVVMVANFIETQKTICKAAIAFSIDPAIEWNKVDNMAKINFYRILQEAFQNINKYANAQNVTVAFQKTNDTIVLTIQDDGVGFVNSRKKKGIGLQNMDSRIQSSGGSLHIESQPQQGTLLRFELPLATNI